MELLRYHQTRCGAWRCWWRPGGCATERLGRRIDWRRQDCLLGQTPDLTRQRLVELAAKGASLTALAQWSGWDQAKAIVLDAYPLPEATDELVAALLRRRYTSAEAARILAGKS